MDIDQFNFSATTCCLNVVQQVPLSTLFKIYYYWTWTYSCCETSSWRHQLIHAYQQFDLVAKVSLRLK